MVGLGVLSWVATYIGMLELIEANMGDLPIAHRLVIGFSVAMLMTMIIWLLDQLFAPVPAFTKFVYVIGYIFLTIISVGFGFGFYWKVLESRAESSRSAKSAVTQVQGSLHAAATRLDQLQSTLVTLAQVSSEKAEMERTKGTSCPNSRPGDGPRRKMRDEDAARFTFASDFVKGRVSSVKGELKALDGDLVRIAANDPAMLDPKTGTRNEFMKALSRKLDLTVTGFNAFRTDPQLRQLRTELSDRAEKSTFGDPKKGGFVCPDAQLQGALRGAVKAIDLLPEMEKPKIAAVEGAEATIEAFRRLTATFFGLLSFKLPPTADELRELQQKAVQSVESPGTAVQLLDPDGVGLSKRDYIPLAVALFVDLCLLLVSMGRPVDRLGGLLPRMRAAERSPVSQILSRFNDIHRDEDVRQTFEVFRHVVFDQGGVYYVAVPLDAPYHMGPRQTGQRFGYGSEAAQELQHEAHLLANLFTGFEQERIFSRVYSPLLSTRLVQRKLARQGSKFAGCEAFRIYKFRDGAWPEIILGAVMGAARRAEQQKARDVAAGHHAPDPRAQDLDLDLGATADRSAMPGPRNAPPQARPRSPMERAARTERRYGGREAEPVDPRMSATYGPYARRAQADLQRHLSDAEAETEVRAANSNTMPRRDREPESTPDTVTPPPGRESGSPTVVALPLRPRPQQVRGGDGDAPKGYAEPMVDVVMRRETATFRVPVSHATLPETLMAGAAAPVLDVEPATQQAGDVTGALTVQTEDVGSRGMDPAAAAEAPDATVSTTVALTVSPTVWELPASDTGDDAEFPAITEDVTLDDVADMAGRLRPARPAV